MLCLANVQQTQATQVNDTSKLATATVSIAVLDINDNIPVFDQASYSANVSELEEAGETLLTVSVSDKDEVSVTHALFPHCSFLSPIVQDANAVFELQLEDLLNSTSPLPFSVLSSGAITLSSPLDFEETEYYLFNVSSSKITFIWQLMYNYNDEGKGC